MKPMTRLLAVSAVAILAACSSDDKKNHDDDHSHHHAPARLLISDQNSNKLYVYDAEDGEFKNWSGGSETGTAPGNNAHLILAQDGLSAAVFTDHKVDIVDSGWHHDHWHSPALLGSQDSSGFEVIATLGHFSYLDQGVSYLWHPGEEPEALTTVDTQTETYPAIVMTDNEYQFHILFADNKAKVYKLNTDGDLAQEIRGNGQPREQACTTPAGAVQNGDNLVVNCGSGTAALLNVHGNHAHTYAVDFGTDLADTDGYQWIAGHDGTLFGYSASTVIKLVGKTNDENDIAQIDPAKTGNTAYKIADTFDGDICYAGFETSHQETLFIVTDKAKVYFLDDEGETGQNTLTLDESDANTLRCDDIVARAASDGLLVADNNISKIYLIDAHGNDYHIHGRIHYLEKNIAIADFVVLQEREHDDHDDHSGHSQ